MKVTTILLLLILIFVTSCVSKKLYNSTGINEIGKEYVKLGLAIGQYDPDFVDAYYGPDSLKPLSKSLNGLPKDSLIKEVDELLAKTKELSKIKGETGKRANWMNSQLVAYKRRIRIATSDFASFDEESKDLFGVEAPHYNEQHFKSILNQLNDMLPGTGTVNEKVESLSKQFIIPKDKLDTVFKVAIAEARRRTATHFTLPTSESFTIEYVTGKPWSGYNWYKGNYKSVIQINTDLPIYIERAIDLACHEGYPGHHVYNVLLEKNLYRDKGWVEISMYPLFSPQSIIAEGSANYGIAMAFPGVEGNEFAANILLPLAGIDTSKASIYFKMLELKGKLNYARNEAARGFLNGTLTEKEAIGWLTDYSLFTPAAAAKSLSFIKGYRSYVINYNYGQDLIKNYIESNGGTESNVQKRWKLFGEILSNPVTPVELLNKQ